MEHIGVPSAFLYLRFAVRHLSYAGAVSLVQHGKTDASGTCFRSSWECCSRGRLSLLMSLSPAWQINRVRHCLGCTCALMSTGACICAMLKTLTFRGALCEHLTVAAPACRCFGRQDDPDEQNRFVYVPLTAPAWRWAAMLRVSDQPAEATAKPQKKQKKDFCFF